MRSPTLPPVQDSARASVQPRLRSAFPTRTSSESLIIASGLGFRTANYSGLSASLLPKFRGAPGFPRPTYGWNQSVRRKASRLRPNEAAGTGSGGVNMTTIDQEGSVCSVARRAAGGYPDGRDAILTLERGDRARLGGRRPQPLPTSTPGPRLPTARTLG